MRILLDPHYSDFWADPQKQPIPASWPQDLPSLATKVHDYTRDALDALAAQGTPAQMLQLGNEIRNGILWPTGQLDGSADQWDRLGTLLRAAAAGARDARGPTPRLVVHYDQGGDNAGSRWFYDNVVAQHVPFDIIGLSYYPFWHGTLSQLRTNVDDLAQRYQRDVSVVETQYGVDARQRRPGEQLPVDARPAGARLPGHAGRSARLRLGPRCRSSRRSRRPRARRLLLAAGVDPGHRLAAGRRHAERQPDAVRLQRARAAGREPRRPAAGLRALRAGAGRRAARATGGRAYACAGNRGRHAVLAVLRGHTAERSSGADRVAPGALWRAPSSSVGAIGWLLVQAQPACRLLTPASSRPRSPRPRSASPRRGVSGAAASATSNRLSVQLGGGAARQDAAHRRALDAGPAPTGWDRGRRCRSRSAGSGGFDGERTTSTA